MAPVTSTPPATIICPILDGRAFLLELPLNDHYAILEGCTLPKELGFPETFPRLYSVVGLDRSGAHVHKVGTESEIMWVVAGSATVHLWDENGMHAEIVLTLPHSNSKFQAVLVPSGVWHTVRYRPGTALNVAASCVYNREYYVEDPTQYFTQDGLGRYGESMRALI